jgi:ATP-dependent protease ClpP protease subunit
MTIHPVRINGLVLGVPQTYRYLHDMQGRIVDFICHHSHIERARLEALMMTPDNMATDVGSILEGREAVECGLIDEVGGLAEALGALHAMT